MTGLFAGLAVVAFAANSVLCRLALAARAIDPLTFTSVRFASGAVTLYALLVATRRNDVHLRGTWMHALVLALYALPFSIAYTELSAGTGALLLFGTVQVTMWFAALRGAERPGGPQWIGVSVALCGLVYLVLPGLSAPPVVAAALMALAGLAWGLYSLQGRGTSDPTAHTLGNFVRVLPFLFVVNALAAGRSHAEPYGVALAVASGSLASGVGYVCWYAALRHLTAIRAAVVQLLVPVLAAAAGVALLDEALSPRLVLAGAMIVGGVALTLRK